MIDTVVIKRPGSQKIQMEDEWARAGSGGPDRCQASPAPVVELG